MSSQPEVWLRGPVSGVSPRLQPAAHALLQTVEDVEQAVDGLNADQLWTAPGGAASVGFHLLHLAGATDRLLTYARGETLNDAQRARLQTERNPPRTDVQSLLADLRRAVEGALEQLRATPDQTLEEARAIGRAALPTTVLGLLFHTAEHAQRHAGQVVTTSKILRALGSIQATASANAPR
jgi:uncharacterized damage-inducible protein DinB